MSDNSQPVTVDVNTDNLDDFSKLMDGSAKPTTPPEGHVEEAKEEATETTDVEDDPLAPEEAAETDETSEDDPDGEESEEEKPKAKPKSRFQERIDQLTASNKETQRLLDAALARLNTEADNKEQKPAPKTEALVETAPKPDDLQEDGSAKYELGEFDPTYIRDLTRFTIRQETEAARAEDREAEMARKAEEARTALTSEWSGKLEEAHETYPDLTEKNSVLQDTFSGIEPRYGEYLASTIMSMDHGIDVLYYLGNNLEEAQRIVASGPTKATIALGRIEGRFADADDQKAVKKPKVSNAPTPPPTATRGVSTKNSTAADTDDLDAFEKMFYATKR